MNGGILVEPLKAERYQIRRNKFKSVVELKTLSGVQMGSEVHHLSTLVVKYAVARFSGPMTCVQEPTK